MKALSKHDRGAVLFQTWFNQLWAGFKELEDRQLKILRSTVEINKRLNMLEETTKLLSQVVFEEEPTVKFTCISCDKTFKLSLPEATAQNFTVLCPVCHNWALPFEEAPEYTLRQISQLTGFSYSTAVRATRELGVKIGQRDKRFTRAQFERIRTILEEKTPRPRKAKEEVEARR